MKPPTPPPIAVLVSGGLDSAVLAAGLASEGREVKPIFIRQSLRWERIEVLWLRRFLSAFRSPSLQPLAILDLSMRDVYGLHWSTGNGAPPDHQTADKAVYLPGRNLTLISKAAVFCAMRNIFEIAIGILARNPFPDASAAFLESLSQTLSAGLGHRFVVRAPFRDLAKADVIRRGRRWPLELTFSCLEPQGTLHCGTCNKCAERRRAFVTADVVDKTRYASPSPVPSPQRGGERLHV